MALHRQHVHDERLGQPAFRTGNPDSSAELTVTLPTAQAMGPSGSRDVATLEDQACRALPRYRRDPFDEAIKQWTGLLRPEGQPDNGQSNKGHAHTGGRAVAASLSWKLVPSSGLDRT